MEHRPVFPFVVGCPRSGTTLLRVMLDSHSKLAIPPESFFVPDLGRTAQRGFDPEAFTTVLFEHERFKQWRLPTDALDAVRNATDGPDAIRALYRAYARYEGKPRYGDKTPQYVTEIDTLAPMFPEARFVHLIRDGRDVAQSLLAAPFGPGTVATAARTWRRYVLSGRRAGAPLGHARYLEIAYEALVEDPENVLRSICGFLGLSFEPEMLDYTSRADPIITGSSHPDVHASLRSPPTAGLRDWRETMSHHDAGVFEAIAGEVLAGLGYELAFEIPPLRHRLQARRELAPRRVRSVRRALARRGRDATRSIARNGERTGAGAKAP